MGRVKEQRKLPLVSAASEDRRRRRVAYALPTLFTAGNVFLGFLAIVKSFQGALLAASGSLGNNPHFELAAKSICVAVLLDGLDGRIARMTNTVSEFGQEMDSLADVITFGVAPAVLAVAWGVHFVDGSVSPLVSDHLRRLGYLIAFLFLVCGAVRLARFNVQKNPVPKNPGRPDRKYFVGLPIPAAAALVATIVYAFDGAPIESWAFSVAWLGLLALLSFLMVSTWRYRSFKDVQLLRAQSPVTVVLFGGLFYLIWNFSQPVLLAMATTYVGSGVAVRLGGIARRRLRHSPPHAERHSETGG